MPGNDPSGNPARPAPDRARRDLLKAGAGLGLLALAGLPGRTPGRSPRSILVFHAGSLAPPFSAAEPLYEEATGIPVTREARGSVASTKKITRLGRRADALAVSDFRLLRDLLLPGHGDWYALFATNAMALQYRSDSPGADRISSGNWWQVLARPGVRIGHSDPAIDPGGYRAVMSLQLGRTPFRGNRLYDEGTYRRLRENTRVSTDTEIHLRSQLRAGKLDYALYYRSLASTSGMPWIDLQPEVDLSRTTPEYAEHYARAEVATRSGTFTGAPIAYGITVPAGARSAVGGARWVGLMLSEPGRRILREKGLEPMVPAVVPERTGARVPERVMDHAEARAGLGPLEL